ncbi:MAG: hypothetical protein IT353_04835 [Gemmatimonadaceae bacterium]|nr:hypothetical protein [Gemmatimonadaceae bacterium]
MVATDLDADCAVTSVLEMTSYLFGAPTMTNDEMDDITERYLLDGEIDCDAVPPGAEDELVSFLEDITAQPAERDTDVAAATLRTPRRSNVR